jgi:hypothetical protein
VSEGERTGVLVLRVWIERDAGNGLRARITAERELGSGERTSVAAVTIEQILGYIRTWVEEFVAAD